MKKRTGKSWRCEVFWFHDYFSIMFDRTPQKLSPNPLLFQLFVVFIHFFLFHEVDEEVLWKKDKPGYSVKMVGTERSGTLALRRSLLRWSALSHFWTAAPVWMVSCLLKQILLKTDEANNYCLTRKVTVSQRPGLLKSRAMCDVFPVKWFRHAEK